MRFIKLTGWKYTARVLMPPSAPRIVAFYHTAFLHGSVPHIFFNMYALLSLGSFLEKHYGHGNSYFCIFWLGSLVMYFHSYWPGENGYSVGASTAVFGLVAAEVVFFYQNRKLFGSQAKQAISNAVFIIAVNLFIGLTALIIGDMLAGCLAAQCSRGLPVRAGKLRNFPNFHLQDEREFRDSALAAGLVILIFGALAAFGLFWL